MCKLSKIIVLLLFMASCAFADWTGSTSEPANMKKIDGKTFYVITSADELAWFAAKVNGGSTDINAVLANDIVFGKNVNTTGTVSWTPIGSSKERQFAGVLDGAGYTIYGLYVKRSSNAGFLGYLAETGIVKNIHMIQGNIIAEGTSYVGAIAAVNYGMIQNSENQNLVYSSSGGTIYFGGLVGLNEGIILDSYNSGDVLAKSNKNTFTSEAYSGGIAGYNNGKIQNCYNRGHITALDTARLSLGLTTELSKSESSYSGGIAGINNGIISDCFNSNSVESQVYLQLGNPDGGKATSRAVAYSGGIVGFNTGNVFRCYNDAEYIYSDSYSEASSGKGQRYFNDAEPIQGVQGSSNTMAISYSYSGGIGGYNEGLIHDCYSYSVGLSNSKARSIYVKLVRTDAKLNINGLTAESFDAKIDEKMYQDGIIGLNASGGSTKSSYYKTEYWLNNTKVKGTAENMQKDQFAWILNTCNGTEENSGAWTRGTDGYPTFANEDSLAIYKVVFDDDGATSNRYTNYKGLVTFPENPEPAEGLVFSGWFNADDTKVKSSTVFTADQTVKAVYTDASDVFWTINFYNAAPADTILETKSYQHGSIVNYGGVEPTLAATAKYTYKFKGWDVEPTNAVEDFDYHAVYDSTIRSYKILFNDFDGKLVESATIEYGKMPSCSKTPTRAATAEWKYTHKGWRPALDYVTEETSYTAIYDSVKVEYKVIFMNGVDVIDEQMVPYGDAAVAPTNVTREGYKFVGWNTSFAKITGNLTVKALFEELIIHTVNVFDGDGKKINDKKVEDGEKYTLPEAPKKDGHTFDGWYNVEGKLVGYPGDKITVTEDLTLEAKYTAINYPITFADEKGSKISSVEVAYGQMPTAPKDPTKASTAQYTYTFKGWSPTLASVTGAATYTAIFDSTLHKYTITFKNGTTALQTSDVAYGSKPSYTGSTPTKSSTDRYAYTFKGWNPSIETVTGTAIYTAVFDSTLRKYTVTFKNGTTTMQTSDVAYGTKPSYTGNTPTKSSTDKYSYTFKGWSPMLASVTGAATYAAVFDSTLRKYTITFKNGSTTLQTSDVAYGVKPSYTGTTPTKKATNKYTYKFKGWNPAIAAVTKAATYQAVFDSTKVTGIVEGRLASLGLSMRAVSRSIQISAAPKNSTYAVLDMQGRVLLSGRVESANFNIAVPNAGSYLVRVGNATRKVQVK